MTTCSGTPARARLRTAVRRNSCGMRPGQPAATRAFRHAFFEPALRDPLAGLLARRVAEDIASDGALFASAAPNRVLLFEDCRSSLVSGKHAPVVVVRRAGIESHLAGLQVDLASPERQDLAPGPPAGDV